MKNETLQLSSFFEGLKAGINSFREMWKSFDRKMAFDFNSLHFFRPGENKISEILAFFLDPTQTHGQDRAFLNQFLKYFRLCDALKLCQDKPVSVRTEHATDKGRRVDITITIGNADFIVGIENKVGTAADQNKQLFDYNKFLKKTSNGSYLLLYLTPDESNPSAESLSEKDAVILKNSGHFRCISYSTDIISLFDQFTNCCEADNVRSFIKDFTQHLKSHFRGDTFMSENNYITDYATKSAENQRVALDVIFSRFHVLDSLIESLKGEILSWMELNNINDRYTLSVDRSARSLLTGNAAYKHLLSVQKNTWSKTEIEIGRASCRERVCMFV